MSKASQQDFGEIERLAAHLDAFLADEGKRLAGLITASASRLQVLHGRHGAGKTTVVRRHLIASLGAFGTDVYYGDCEPKFPRTVAASTGSSADILEAIQRPGAVVIIDDFDQHLAVQDAAAAWAFDNVFGKFDTVVAKIVVVVSDDHLSSVFDFRDVEPKCVEAVFQIREIEVGAGLHRLAEDDHETDFEIAPDLIDALSAELKAKAEGVSPELLALVYHQLRTFHLKSDKKITLLTREHYAALGGLIGILRRHVREVLPRMRLGGDRDRGDIAAAILREIVGASASGRSVDFSEVCRRLDVSVQTYNDVLSQLAGRGGLVKEVVPGVYSVAPPQLIHGIREHLAELAKSLEGPRHLVDEGTRQWEHLGLLLPEDRFREIHAQRHFLLLGAKAIELMLRCSLVYDNSQTNEMTSYWHRRLNDPGKALDVFGEHLYHRFDDVRARAAALLQSHAAEAREQLHLIALQDPSDRVSDAAIATLAHATTQDLRRLLLQEAGDTHSPYRKRAVRALRIFPDPDTATVLGGLVEDSGTDVGLRQEAIRSLAASRTNVAVDALVDIGLGDRDADDRECAASALGTVDESTLSEYMLRKLRDPRARREGSAWHSLRAALGATGRLVAAGVLAVVALLVHGSAFAFLKRWRILIAFVVIEIVSYVFLGVVGWFVLAGGLFLSLAVPTGMLLAGLRAGTVAPGSLRHMLAGWLFLLLGLVSLVGLHGLAHALVGRWSRALWLFVFGLLGATTLIYFAVPGEESSFISESGRVLYLTGGAALFLGSWLFDVGVVAYRWLLFPTRMQQRARLDTILRAIVPNPVVADRLFGELRSDDHARAHWSGAVLARYGGMIAAEQLVDRLQSADGAELRCVVSSLTKADGDTTVNALTQLYRRSARPIRARIETILARSGSQRSLAALRGLGSELSWSGKLRYHLSSFTLPFRLLPFPIIALLVMAAPLLAGFAYDIGGMMRHPERAVFAMLDRSDVVSLARIDEFVSGLNRRSALAEAGARAFPGEATRALTRALTRWDTIRRPWVDNDADNERVTSALDDYRVRLVKALGTAAVEVPDSTDEDVVDAAELLEHMHDSGDLPDDLATEVMVALLAIHSDRGSEVGVAETLGIANWDNPQAWRAPLAALQPAEQQAVLRALQTLATEHAENILVAVAVGSDNRQQSRANTRSVPDLEPQDTELKRQVVVTLGGLPEDRARAGLERVVSELKESGRAASVVGAAERQLESLGGYGRLRAQLESFEYAQVIETGERLLVDRRDPILLALVGRAYQGIGNCERSVEYLEVSGTQLDNDYAARDSLVGCYDELAQDLLYTDPAMAVELLEKALSYDASSPSTQASHALALVLAERHEEGFAEAAALIQSGSEYWEAYEALSEAAKATDTWPEAEQVLVAAVDARPAAMLPRSFLAFVYHEARTFEDDAYFEKAYELRRQLRDEFGPDQSHEANYIETCLTTMRYQEASDLARAILEAPYVDSGLAVPMSLERYIALVLNNDRSETARAALEQFAEVAAESGFDGGWTYDGAAYFVEQRDLPGRPLSLLMQAVMANGDGVDEALAANRALFTSAAL